MDESTNKPNLESNENTVKIVSISPDNSKPLHIGDNVEMELDVEYSVSRSPAQIGLNIQNGDISNEEFVNSIGEESDKVLALLIATKSEVISKKQGNVIIKQSFVVPEVSSIQVFASLMLEGDQSTDKVDTKFYKVVARDAE